MLWQGNGWVLTEVSQYIKNREIIATKKEKNVYYSGEK